MRTNRISANFSGGEVDSLLDARSDLPLFAKALSWMENFTAQATGAAVFRTGTKYVHHTRNHNPARFIPFQFNDEQSYLVEVTDGFMRFYKDGAIIVDSTPNDITGITKANPGVLTYTGADFENGQEVYVTGVVGMTEVNGRFFTVASVNTGANTFQLHDEFGNNINTTGYTTYSSGGTAARIYENKVIFEEAYIETIKHTQNADAMYLTHEKYEPRQLIRIAHDNWTCDRYARTADPFASNNGTYGTITGITQANPAVVTDAAHGMVNGSHVYITSIGGMVEVNDRHFTARNCAADTYELEDYLTGVAVNSTGYTAFSSNGIGEKINSQGYPSAVAFTDAVRTVFGGSDAHPERLDFSRSPSSAGAVRFDDFTQGAGASNAMEFTLAPLNGKVNKIQWITNTDKYLAVGTFGAIRRVFGATEGDAVAVDAITAKSANSEGCANIDPIVIDPAVFYVNRTGLSLESIAFDYTIDGYQPDDRNVVTTEFTTGGIKQIVRQRVRSADIIWAVRNDGVLLGFTYNAKQAIGAWHHHTLGGDGVVEWAGVMPRDNNYDQLWLIVKRTINGNEVRYVEYISDEVVFPNVISFFGQGNTLSSDRERWLNYMWELAKSCIHVDACLTYDGSSYGTDAAAAITVGADADIEGTTGVVFSADAAVFTSAMVGREIWGKMTSEGLGGGRALITSYTNSTHVVVTILDTFPPGVSFAAGDWFLTATTVSGLYHLEGATVTVVADGAKLDDAIVASAAIDIGDNAASVIHVGLPYAGILQTLPLDQGANMGPAQNKTKIVPETRLRLKNSAPPLIGASLYQLEQIVTAKANDITGRATPLFTGELQQMYADQYDPDKRMYVYHNDPKPCTLVALDIFIGTADD